MTKPNPGTKEAIEAGCTCPVLDNNYGRGIPIKTKDGTIQTGYWMDGACPLHGFEEPSKEDINNA
jgi:hypothetical protein